MFSTLADTLALGLGPVGQYAPAPASTPAGSVNALTGGNGPVTGTPEVANAGAKPASPDKALTAWGAVFGALIVAYFLFTPIDIG